MDSWSSIGYYGKYSIIFTNIGELSNIWYKSAQADNVADMIETNKGMLKYLFCRLVSSIINRPSGNKNS